MSTHRIEDFQPVPNRPGRSARDLVGSAGGFEGMFVTETVMEPGSSIPLHTHTVEEGWVVLAGELSFQGGEESIVAAADTSVRVAPGVPHSVVNHASTPARALTAAPWSRATFYQEATHYLEGEKRVD